MMISRKVVLIGFEKEVMGEVGRFRKRLMYVLLNV